MASALNDVPADAEFWRLDCGREDPHPPHRVEHRAHMIGDPPVPCHSDKHPAWCYGVPDPETLRGRLEELRPGQRVRVVFEGVVDEPIVVRAYAAEFPALSITGPGGRRSTADGDDMVVLRYYGTHPSRCEDPDHLRGRVHRALTDVVVLDAPTRAMTAGDLRERIADLPADTPVVVNAADDDGREVFAAVRYAELEPTCGGVDVLRLYANREPEWSGAPDPCDPGEFWIDDATGERVNATTGERTAHECPPGTPE